MVLIDRRVYIVDDDELVRATLRRMLTAAGIYTTEFQSAADYLAEHASLPLGCVLLDLRLPEMDGLEVLRTLRKRSDQNPVVMISGRADIPDAVAAIKIGAVDFLQKPFRRQQLLAAIDNAFASMAPRMQQRGPGAPARLTRRELDVLRGVARGATSRDIGQDLGISSRTVEMHRANARAKLGAKGATQAVLIAKERGLL